MRSIYQYLLLRQLVKYDLMLKPSTSSLCYFSSAVRKARKRKQDINPSTLLKINVFNNKIEKKLLFSPNIVEYLPSFIVSLPARYKVIPI